MNEFERLFGQQQSVRLLQSIEVAAWLIAGLLLIVVAVLLVGIVKRGRAKHAQSDWNEIVEKAYEAGQYEKALQTLGSCELLFPRSASVKFWQGRCHFQQESWDKAVEKFEACCRLEPPYRRSVRDYMAFIESNDLVPGVTGYLKKGRALLGDAGEGA
jgi:tetratricopeptide (TPR) repeat protein